MRTVQVTPGAEECITGIVSVISPVAEFRRQGHDVPMIPLSMPREDENQPSGIPESSK